MSLLVLRAYLMLVAFDFYLGRRNFRALYSRVRGYPVTEVLAPRMSIAEICAAVDVASIWYWKQALCLQRSAATTCLLKRAGVDARMIIGAQQMPFKAHAWVEVGGRVVNDKPYMRELYAVLDAC